MPRWSGQGKVFMGQRTALGDPGPMRWVGEVDSKGASLDMKLDIFKTKESSSGQRATLDTIVQGKEAMLKFGFMEWDPDNIALQIMGHTLTVAGGTVTGEALDQGIAGDFISLDHPKVSSLVVKDSATPTPAMLTGTHYNLDSPDFGRILLKDISGLELPLVADYSYAARKDIPIMTQQLHEAWVRFELVNTAPGGGKTLVEFYRVQIPASKTLQLIQEKGIGIGDVEAEVVIDPTKPVDGTLGQFGRVMLL